eukprot:4160576-Prymnesium_polylepis.1
MGKCWIGGQPAQQVLEYLLGIVWPSNYGEIYGILLEVLSLDARAGGSVRRERDPERAGRNPGGF